MTPNSKRIAILLVLLIATVAGGQVPNSAQGYLERAATNFKLGKLDAVITDCSKAIQLDPKLVLAYYLRGNALVLQRRLDDALPDYDKVIELAPNAPGVEQVYGNRGAIRESKGDAKGALADVNKAIALNADYGDPYTTRGNIRSEQGDIKGALADYDKAILINPNDTPAYVGRGMIRYQQDDLDLALKDYDNVIRLEPRHPQAHIDRGVIKGLKGQIDAAIVDIRAGAAIDAAAIAENQPSTFSTPFSTLGQYISAHPTKARAIEMRGLIRLMNGNVSGADQDLRECVKLAPELQTEIDRVRPLMRSSQ